MANEKNERIEKLKQRFTQHAVGRPQTAKKTRGRDSFYLDTALTQRIGDVYKSLSHELYPKTFSKSLFLETLLEYGLENITEIKKLLLASSVSEDES